ncbi:protein kinase [Neptunomonas sp.]|uniref:protein kinase domain-containing protein n=1 Tax=Neptunomonas sp. TaxID=1971898 RepID=UPI003511FE55
MSQKLDVNFGGYSIAGLKSLNQDSFAASNPTGNEREFKGIAAAIADGVSSCEDSHIASQTAVTSFISDYLSTSPSWSVSTSASRVLTSLNRWLFQENQSRQGHLSSMLTTFSSVVIKSSSLYCFHVGDSRIYLMSNGNLEQLSTDHVLNGGSQEYLSRALGADSHLEVDFFKRLLNEGDRVLMTTDGVHGFLSQSQLKTLMLAEHETLEEHAKAIVNAAVEAGSDDNLTALILDIRQLGIETLDETQQRLTRLPIPPVLTVGNKIDGYEVQQVIFSGTRSHMYLVKDIESNDKYVLKAPSENFTEDLVYLDGFIREEWVGQTLDHNNVMKTFRPLRPKQFMYYLGEYIEGTDLRQWMRDNPEPSIDVVRQITKQIIAGLRAFQRKDMVHQDLKPENIMLTVDGTIKILDFGTVLVAGSNEIISPLDKSIPQGSVNYIAPEYLMGESGNSQSDLFSLAVIVYELLTGKLPYKERPPNAAQLKYYSELDYLPSIQHRKDLPLWIEGCLRKALQPNPSHRYAAFSEFLHDLTVPNRSLEASIKAKPLMERNPTLFWQSCCAALVLVNIYQWLF